jgi:hypothetical protein
MIRHRVAQWFKDFQPAILEAQTRFKRRRLLQNPVAAVSDRRNCRQRESRRSETAATEPGFASASEICDAGFDVLDVSIERNKSHGKCSGVTFGLKRAARKKGKEIQKSTSRRIVIFGGITTFLSWKMALPMNILPPPCLP